MYAEPEQGAKKASGGEQALHHGHPLGLFWYAPESLAPPGPVGLSQTPSCTAVGHEAPVLKSSVEQPDEWPLEEQTTGRV